MKRLLRRFRYNKMYKYYLIVFIIFSCVFFFSVGYAALNGRLITKAITNLNIGTNATGYCSVQDLSSAIEVDFSYDTYSDSQGVYHFDVKNSTEDSYEYLTLIFEKSSSVITSDAWSNSGSIVTSAYDEYVIVNDHRGWMFAPNSTNSYSLNINYPSGTNFNLSSNQYRAFFSNEPIDFECINDEWYINGKIANENQSDNHLSELIVNGYTLTPQFNPNIYSYEITVGANVDSITINATPRSENANVDITGNNHLSYGENQVIIKVSSEDDTYKNYIIKVIKEENTSESTTTTTSGGGNNENPDDPSDPNDFSDLNPNFAEQGININFSAPWSSQYFTKITNNTNFQITEWMLHLYVGTGLDFSDWGSSGLNWSGAKYIYNSKRGILSLYFEKSNPESVQFNDNYTLDIDQTVEINGDVNTGVAPVLIGFTYKVVEQ